LIWSDRIEGARVLDLFAGSGVVGLEALGRGALSAVAVDQSARAVEILEANAGKLGERLLDIRRLTLPGGIPRLSEQGPFDLVYADPPYNFPMYPELLEAVAPLLALDGEVVVEHSSRREVPIEVGPLTRTNVRKYGESALSFYRSSAVDDLERRRAAISSTALRNAVGRMDELP
jgi:16S rRNA (guanine(966)-N(2))-methyltransferase RsmD